jgi:copper resistance protein B
MRRAGCIALALLSARVCAHTPPDPPQETMAPMSAREMTQMMQMDDTHPFGTALFDQLEWRHAQGQAAGAWDAQAWYGGDSDRVWAKSAGTRVGGGLTSASAELLWDRAVSEWWSVQVGGRNDFGTGPSRTWAALGIEGVAPYRFDTEATVYVGEGGRTAARVKVEYDLYLTQRWVLQPKAELNVYGKSDPARRIASGLSDLELGARLRYEFRRECAPYVGLNWSRLSGSPADLALVLGVRFWF